MHHDSTGLYRLVTVISILLSNLSFLAVFLRWRGGTGWAETLYGFPIGLGFGVSLSSAYIGLTAGLEPFQVAVGTSGFYMCLNLGSLFGVSAASMLISTFVERALRKSLAGLPDAERIIRNVTSNFDRINELPGKIAEVVLRAYTKSFVNVWCELQHLSPEMGFEVWDIDIMYSVLASLWLPGVACQPDHA
jgi:hypothetical protein